MSIKTFPTGFSDIGPTVTVSSTLLADDGTNNGTVTPTEVLALFGVKQTAGVPQVVTNPTGDDNSLALASTAFVARQTSGVFQVACAGGVDVTVSPPNSGNGILVLTGTLTANINVIVPTISRVWIVGNNTTGPFTVNFKTVTGTGVLIPQGVNLEVFSNGTNIYVVAGPAATATIAGTVKPGTGLSVTADGTLNASGGGGGGTSTPTPVATATTVGTVKPGAGLAVAPDGTLALATTPLSYLIWRVLCHGVPSGNVVSIAELVLASVSGGATLCSGGTATSSGSVGGFVPANAFDGNPSTLWASALSPPTDQWVQYAFATAVSVAEIRMTVRNDGNLDQAPGAFDLQGSNDGVTFTTVKSCAAPVWNVGQTQTFVVSARLATPVATATTVGSVKPGAGLAVATDGTLSVISGASSGSSAAAKVWRVLIHSTAQPNAAAGASTPVLAEIVFANVASGASIATGGTAQSSSDYSSGYVAANAFDGNPSTFWNCNNSAPPDQWIQYTFATPVSLAEVRITSRPDVNGVNQSPGVWDLQSSTDGVNFAIVKSYSSPTWTAGQTQTFAVPAAPGSATTSTPVATAATVGVIKPGAGLSIGPDGTLSVIGSSPTPSSYSIWRVVVHSNASDVVSIAEIVMASVAGGATLCSGGTATASTINSAGLEPSKAFDGNPSTFWASSVGTPPDQWIQYAFAQAVLVKEIRVSIRNDGYLVQAPSTFELQGSNDGSTFVKVGSTYISAAWTATGQTQTFAVSAAAPILLSVQVASYHPGKTVATEVVSMFIASQSLLIPAGFAGMVFYAVTLPTAPVNFSASFLHAGAWTALGVVTVSATGVLTLPSNSAQALQVGDVFKLVGPDVPDATLQDFCFNVPFLRT